MPIYEYGCYDCRKRVSIFWRTFSAAEANTPICPRCNGDNLKRLVSKVAMIRSDETRLESLSDPANLSGLDEDDPKSLAKFMRQMGQEAGEDLGSEFDEVVDRLESGQSPDEIEQELPDLGTGVGSNATSDDWFD
ncbi:MAG: zinc ribbon domain-containing protein [Chloroflexota bacterium]